MRRIAGGLGALLVVACTSVERQIAEDSRAVAGDVRARAEFAPSPTGDPVVEGAMRGLLEDGLTEADAVKIALLNNRTVQASYERLGIARADLVQAGLLANPVFDANAKFFSGGTEIEFGLLQPLFDVFFRPLRERHAEHAFAVVKAAVTRDLVHLAFTVRREFVRLCMVQRLVAVQQQVHDVARARHELMVKLHAAGNVTDPQVTAEQAMHARARLDLAAAEQAAREAHEPLHVLMGLWGDDVGWRLAGSADSLDRDPPLHAANAEARAVAASLDLVESRARIDAAAQSAGVVEWEGWLREPMIGAAAKKEVGNGWGFGPALALQIPLFDAGGARLAGAQAELRHALHRHVQIAVQIRSAARLLRDRCAAADERVAFLAGELLPVRARFVRETQQNYNAMQIGAFEVLGARQVELAAAREHLEAVRDARLARLDLEELLAGSLDQEVLAARWPRILATDEAPAAGH